MWRVSGLKSAGSGRFPGLERSQRLQGGLMWTPEGTGVARKIIEDESAALADLGSRAPRPQWRERQLHLPLSELSGDEFEVFCFLLLKREHPEEKVYYYGKTCDAGRDIVHIRPDETVQLIQCKRSQDNAGSGVLKAELAKLYANIFNKVIPQRPDEVAFYVVPDLTSPAQSLLDDQNQWRSAAPKALRNHLGQEPSAELLEFANSWWPTWDRENALCLTERCQKRPDLRDQFFGVKKVTDASREDICQDRREDLQPLREGIERIEGLFTPKPPTADLTEVTLSRDELAKAFREASASLLNWPTTLGDNRWLARDELDRLIESIQSQDSSTTLLLGSSGSGKSALLAKLGQRAAELGYSVLGIKADKLEHSVNSPARLAQQLHLPALPDTCVRFLATGERVVVLIDQLDALADLVDLRSERLNVLLDLIKRLHGQANVHVVCSCRQFEFQHDVRLAVLDDDDQLTLELPTWEQVCEVLSKAGIDAKNWPEALRESLRVPQHLKVFLQRLRGTAEDQVFTSYQEMLDDLWRQKVSSPDGSELLMDLADAMSQEESFWLPVARFEERENLITALVSEGIFSRPNGGPKVGFQHQTLFEHARARAFARGDGSLTSHVLDRQDGLFVRPTLWSTLTYLRETASGTYATEMQKLCQADLRLHVKYLLIEFLGQVQEPTDQEAVWLLQWLKDPEYRNKTLAALRGNPGWFERLKTSHLPTLMRLGSDKAWPVVWVLTSAWQFTRADCLHLIKSHWLDDEANDSLAFSTLRQLEDWDEEALEFACRIVARTEIDRCYVMLLATTISKSRPELAPKLVAAHLNAQLKKLEAAEDPPPKQRFDRLLEGNTNLHDLPSIAEAAPKAFLDELWPWFLKALEYSLDKPHPTVRRYRPSLTLASDLDEERRHHRPMLDAINTAVRGLATADTDSYLSFIEQWKDFDAVVVQRLLCRGFVKVTRLAPGGALEFLLYDPRRLWLGGHVDSFADTRKLIASLAPHLDDRQMGQLERSILMWSQYHPNIRDEDVGTRFKRRKWDRKGRLRLLKAVPFDRLSPETQALVRAEEEALPEYREQDRMPRLIHSGGSPMSAEQMSKANDENIVRLFEELTDETGWDHPRDRSRGGTIEASMELGKLAKKEPERAVGLLDSFAPGKQERPAGAVIRALGEADYPSAELYELIIKMDKRGFTGSEFRDDAAYALCQRATREDGMPHAVCELLERWLESAPEPVDDYDKQEDKQDGQKERPQSVLWEAQGGTILPNGTYWILRALTYGYLREKPPRADRWLAMLEKHMEREEGVHTWRVMTEELRFLQMCDRDTAKRFLIRLFERFPTVRDSRYGAMLLARLRSFLATDPYVSFLKEMRDSQWPLGPQAYGELVALSYLMVDDARWAEPIIASYLDNLDERDSTAGKVRVGIAFAAANLWQDSACRQKATELLAKLASDASGDLAEAVMWVFVTVDCLYADDHTRSLLSTVAENPNLLSVTTDDFLVDKLEDLVDSDQDLVYRICQEMVQLRGSDLVNFQTSFVMSASHLTSIALTLQRTGGEYREKGLELFESLLVLGVNDAQAALDELDRRPRNVPRSVVRRRRRRIGPRR